MHPANTVAPVTRQACTHAKHFLSTHQVLSVLTAFFLVFSLAVGIRATFYSMPLVTSDDRVGIKAL
jgi:hypothetical protein